MNRSSWIALAGGVAVVLAFIAGYSLLPAESASGGKAVPPASATKRAPSQEAALPDVEPTPDEPAVADAPKADGGAALGLPPLDTGPHDDLCTELEKTRSRLRTAENMLERMPEKNQNGEGAKKLRVVRDRLERLEARYTRRADSRGECGG